MFYLANFSRMTADPLDVKTGQKLQFFGDMLQALQYVL